MIFIIFYILYIFLYFVWSKFTWSTLVRKEKSATKPRRGETIQMHTRELERNSTKNTQNNFGFGFFFSFICLFFGLWFLIIRLIGCCYGCYCGINIQYDWFAVVVGVVFAAAASSDAALLVCLFCFANALQKLLFMVHNKN